MTTDTEEFTAYITKYAFTDGIQEIRAARCVSVNRDMIEKRNRQPHEFKSHFHGEGRDWHLTREGAVKRAEQMRQAKIKSLESAMKKIREMVF